MTSGKRTWTILLAAGALAACSSSGGNGGGSGGSSGNNNAGMSSSSTGGTSGGSGGSSGGNNTCMNSTDAVNQDCPGIPPQTGDCAPRGACCHRTENSIVEKALSSDAQYVELNYRLNYVFTTNHPSTIGDPIVASLSINRSDNEEQSTLLKMKIPRMNGMAVSGMGEFTNYVGRYNCDGTYSFYDNTAAPDKAHGGLTDDTARWVPPTVMAKYDLSKEGTQDFVTVPWSETSSRKLQYVPFVKPADHTYDWELVNQGFRLLNFKIDGDGRDCIGKRDGMNWSAGGQFELYTPMGPNNTQIISTIQESYCTLVGFGITTHMTLNCEKTTRCTPGSASNTACTGGADGDKTCDTATPGEVCNAPADGKPGMCGCSWKKLPDSLCPTNDAEIAMFGCHLGDTNPMGINKEMNFPTDVASKCTMTAPTTPQDPGAGVTTLGQCCDPLGKMTNGLPACNAYRLLNDVVAAAAVITDNTQHGLQPLCM